MFVNKLTINFSISKIGVAETLEMEGKISLYGYKASNCNNF